MSRKYLLYFYIQSHLIFLRHKGCIHRMKAMVQRFHLRRDQLEKVFQINYWRCCCHRCAPLYLIQVLLQGSALCLVELQEHSHGPVDIPTHTLDTLLQRPKKSGNLSFSSKIPLFVRIKLGSTSKPPTLHNIWILQLIPFQDHTEIRIIQDFNSKSFALGNLALNSRDINHIIIHTCVCSTEASRRKLQHL